MQTYDEANNQIVKTNGSRTRYRCYGYTSRCVYYDGHKKVVDYPASDTDMNDRTTRQVDAVLTQDFNVARKMTDRLNALDGFERWETAILGEYVTEETTVLHSFNAGLVVVGG